MSSPDHAPGHPGLDPHWTTSQKNGVGTARGAASHVWFTTSQGILTEVYYPRVDQAAVRDMGLIVTDGGSFFSEEKAATQSRAEWLHDGVPGFHVVNRCVQGRYDIDKIFITDPRRHVLLQQTTFRALQGSVTDYHLYVLLAPHLANQGRHNNAFVSEFKGVPMLMAECSGYGLALASTSPWRCRSVGYVGVSDGWQDLHAHGRMNWEYRKAEDGNVALIGELDLSSSTTLLLALGFGRTAREAAHRARASLGDGFDAARTRYEQGWIEWQNTLRQLASGPKANSTAYRVSTAVLATHESKDFPGGLIASLSFPWGEIQGDKDEGGYHLVWPRDAYETASALLAAGARDEVLRVLHFFEVTQEAEGYWPQNMWLDGTRFWPNIQLDETAAPILLLDLAKRYQHLDPTELARLWPMVRNAAGFILRNGPSTPQDRWEEDAGLTPYTLASVIAALLIAADMADEHAEPVLGSYLRDTADAWNDSIEDWLYAEGTPLARQIGVTGYYARIAPPSRLSNDRPLAKEQIEIPNHGVAARFPADAIVSTDALALVRFGLRAADDPRILNTVRVIDAVLKLETPTGSCWYRYNHDGYGEHADGSPYDGTGIGRLWPLFVGERAHYELARGHVEESRRLLASMEEQAGDSGLISEQIWDADAIPNRHLAPGRPTGSARPLVWAHAEHIKLLRSIDDRAVFDMPLQTVARYIGKRSSPVYSPWRFDAGIRTIQEGRILRLETLAAARVHWTADDWKTVSDVETRNSGIGICLADLDTRALAPGARVVFTFYWPGSDRWEGRNYTVKVSHREPGHPAPSTSGAKHANGRTGRETVRDMPEQTVHDV